MAKKDTEKTFTLDEYDEATLSRFNDGIREGMAIANDIFYDQLDRLKQSLNDVMCILMEEAFETSNNKKMVSELHTAYYAMSVLADRFQDAYFEKLDSLKEPETYDFNQ